MKKKIYNVAVVGLGYVGFPLAIHSKSKGMGVIGIDVDATKVNKINKKINPFNNCSLSKRFKRYPITASTDFQDINKSNVVIICVPTPVKKNRQPDLTPVQSAAKEIGKFLQKDQLIILESTVNPGVTRHDVIPILEKESRMKAGNDFYVSHCPERINPGNSSWTVNTIPRVVGSINKRGLLKTIRFYKALLDSKIIGMESLEEAEAVKILENCFRDVNIAFINEMAMSFNRLGIDVTHVIKGASAKPFGFLAHYPGCGVGGHCIPVDPYYMIDYAKKYGFQHHLLKLARTINDRMPLQTVNLLKQLVKSKKRKLIGMTVAVLGLAYKGNIDDIRQSPSFEIIRILKKNRINVRAFDPYLPDRSFSKSIVNVLHGCDAVILCTDHKEFTGITPALLKKYHISMLIDGKNYLNKKKFLKEGILYRGIGR